MKYSNVAIFGGAGFIGQHMAVYLLEKSIAEKIYILDISPIKNFKSKTIKAFIDDNTIEYINLDVRNSIPQDIIKQPIHLILNFAAVHREPGHEDKEYYETNLYGAENVCQWASSIDCKNIIFTSSIAPYGPSEDPKNECSLPIPVSAYGSSKLVAEKIHTMWQRENKTEHYLSIVRPGVVFGSGEGGNVSRLIKAVKKGYFFYMANKQTRKAGIYIKELCHAMVWVLEHQKVNKEMVAIYNATMSPAPSIEDYVTTMAKVANIKRKFFNMPYIILFLAAHIISFITRPLNINHPFSPVRIRKMVRSNNIVPKYLLTNEYKYQYSLKSALMDWLEDNPSEWLKEKI